MKVSGNEWMLEIPGRSRDPSRSELSVVRHLMEGPSFFIALAAHIDRKPEIWEVDGMKTTLDLPDDLMREIRVLAAREDRKMKDIITESLRRDLRLDDPAPRPSVRAIAPVSLGRVLEEEGERDRLGEMLDERGHRY